jgi:hypothetical protein
MQYTILSLNRKIDRKDGSPLMTAEKQAPDGKITPAKAYMIVNLLLKHEGRDIWVTHFDFDFHTSEWEEGAEIEGVITQKGEYNGAPQYVFNRPKDQKDVVQKFMKRIGKYKDPSLNPQPVISNVPEQERISVGDLPF